jgi:hypothetical protein
VWLVGHWFANEEKNIGSSVFRWRLGGAVLLLAAIVALVA